MTALVPHIPDRDRRRLIGTVALLSSDQPGEVFAAAQAAIRLLQPHRTTLAELIEKALTPTPWPESLRPGPARATDHRHLARMCISMAHLLSSWEYNFVLDISHRHGPLTPKQLAKLKAIEAKIEAGRDE